MIIIIIIIIIIIPNLQKAWDGLIVSNLVTKVLSRASSEVDKARPLAASAPHSGDWLLAPPISSVELKRIHQSLSCSKNGMPSMRATHIPMWKNCRCPWPTRSGVSK